MTTDYKPETRNQEWALAKLAKGAKKEGEERHGRELGIRNWECFVIDHDQDRKKSKHLCLSLPLYALLVSQKEKILAFLACFARVSSPLCLWRRWTCPAVALGRSRKASSEALFYIKIRAHPCNPWFGVKRTQKTQKHTLLISKSLCSLGSLW